MRMIAEFKEFAVRGSVVDMAVGVVIGAAFSKVVTSFVSGVLTPPLGLLAGGVDFAQLRWTLKPADGAAKAVSVDYGLFLMAVLDFCLVALAVFALVRGLNRLRRRNQAAPPPTEKSCPECASVIPINAKRCRFCSQVVALRPSGG